MAIMTPTAGYMLHTEHDAFYDYETTTDSSCLAFGIVSRPQPDGVRNNSKYGYLQDVQIKYNDDGASTSRTRYNTLQMSPSNTVEFKLISTSAQTGWSTAEETPAKTNGEVQVGEGIGLRVDSGVFRSYYTGDQVVKDCAIQALYLERDSDSDSTDFIETTGVLKTGSTSYEWSPYQENEACSSFIMKQVAINNTLITNYKTAECRTYPLVRSAGYV